MERNIFPEIKLFHPVEQIKKIGRFVFDRFYGDQPPLYMSDHYHGTSEMLDTALDEPEQLVLPWPTDRTIPDVAGRDVLRRPVIERPDSGQLNRWDSMGNYWPLESDGIEV